MLSFSSSSLNIIPKNFYFSNNLFADIYYSFSLLFVFVCLFILPPGPVLIRFKFSIL
jgi:hypothetical protein